MSKEKVKTLTDLLISFVYESNSVSLVQNLKNGISNTFDAKIRDLKLERVTKLTKAEGFKDLCDLKSFTTEVEPIEHARHKTLRDAKIMLSKAAMLNLDLEVLPQRLEECKKHLESVKKDLQALLDSFGSAIALEMASVKDLKRCIFKLKE